MIRGKVSGLFRLFRFELPFAAGTCVVLGELLALGTLPAPAQALYGFLTFFFISSTALILNDCFDVETDRINAPNRPIPAGIVTRTEAAVLSVAVALLGFLCSLLISPAAFLVTLLIWTLGFLYNWRLKKSGLWGNLVVSISVGTSFVFGGIVAGNPFEPVVWYLAITAALIDLGEEIAADALDVEGDRAAGSRSLAVIRGPHHAMKISARIFGVVIAGSAIPFVAGWLKWFYLPPLLILDGIIIYSVRNLLDPRRPNRINDIRRIYLGGLGMILAFILLRLALT